MARTSTPLDHVERIDAEAQARTALNEEAERVMANSKPTPTQKENDLLKVGAMHPDDKEDPNNPEMPSTADQQRRIAEAGGPSHPTLQAERAQVAQRRSAEASGGAPYMTRDAAPRPSPAHSSPAHPGTAGHRQPASSVSGSTSQTDKDKDKDGANKP